MRAIIWIRGGKVFHTALSDGGAAHVCVAGTSADTHGTQRESSSRRYKSCAQGLLTFITIASGRVIGEVRGGVQEVEPAVRIKGQHACAGSSTSLNLD